MDELPPLDPGELAVLNHVSRWGRSGYPISRHGKHWHVDGINGYGSFPTVYKTKREAVEQFERYVDLLRLRRVEQYQRGMAEGVSERSGWIEEDAVRAFRILAPDVEEPMLRSLVRAAIERRKRGSSEG